MPEPQESAVECIDISFNQPQCILQPTRDTVDTSLEWYSTQGKKVSFNDRRCYRCAVIFLESSFTACGGIFRSHRNFRISFSCAVENRSQRTFPECYWLLLSMYVIYIAETAYWFGR